MHAESLQIKFHLPGCRSLKEKRRRLGRLREKFGRITNMAVCESGQNDIHDQAQWTFVAIASSRKIVHKTVQDVCDWSNQTLDATITSVHRENIA